MEKRTVLLLKGLPGSGKSVFGNTLALTPKWKRINKDDLRAMIDHNTWTGKNEKEIVRVRNVLLREFMDRGYHVIIDDTNLNPLHEKSIQAIIDEFNEQYENIQYVLQIEEYKTDVSICVKNDLQRENSVGSDVIYSMYNTYYDTHTFNGLHITDILPSAYIVDLDGTLAQRNGRSPFAIDESLLDDVPSTYLCEILASLADEHIIIVSGRDSRAREFTERWLNMYMIQYDALFMRKANDVRKDTIVKKELYETYIKPFYHVVAVFDDRPSVIRMWKEQNLPVLNCDQRMYHSEF